MSDDPRVLALEASQAVAHVIASPQESLPGRLAELARLVAELPGIRESIIVAFDERELPLTAGSSDPSPSGDGTKLETLFELREQSASRLASPAWFEINPSLFQLASGNPSWALPIAGVSRPAAGLVVVTCQDPQPRETFQALVASAPMLCAAIQSAISTEGWNRIERLQGLARETFKSASEEWDLQKLVKELAKLFHAGAATILLEEQDRLLLTASTDRQLEGSGPVVYKREEGLTGYVFASGKPLRLSDTEDGEEIFRVTGMHRESPRHAERDEEGVITGQFLGVPMLFGGRVVGVIRLSRRGGVARFTLQDEKALQFFADLLGAALAPTWSLLLSRSIFETSSEAIAVSCYEQGEEKRSVRRIIMANSGAERLLGWTEDQLKGRDAPEVYVPGEYEKIRKGLENAWDDAKAKGRGEYGPIISKLLRADGADVPVSISYRILANRLVNPPTFYTLGLARDISESERLADRHRRILELLDAIDVAYFQADQNGGTLEPTPAESRITGYSLEELQGLNRERLYPEPVRRRELIDRARRQGGRLKEIVQQMVRKDGVHIWVEGDLRIVKNSQGREIGLEGFYRDVTELIRLQQFLNEDTQKLLKEHELYARLKSDAEFHLDYLTSLGHQLLTPLGSLVETLRNFEKGITNPRQLTERLPYVISQAVVCTRMVRNLSYMDKILRGERFQRDKVSLARLAIETSIDVLPLLKERSLELDVDRDSLGRYLQVQGHREMLRQVIVNLVDNAIKYSLPGSKIIIRGYHWPAGRILEVSNQGLPIPEEEREKIFQRGFRSERAKQLVPHGTGFGLWLVRRIVEAHDASIRCHEVVEEGKKRNAFRITFPHSSVNIRRVA